MKKTSVISVLFLLLASSVFSQNDFSQKIAFSYFKMIKSNEHKTGFKQMKPVQIEVGTLNGVKKLETILKDSLKWALQSNEMFSSENDESKSEKISQIKIESLNKSSKNLINELKGISLYVKSPVNAENQNKLELSEMTKMMLAMEASEYGNIKFINDVTNFTFVNNEQKTTTYKEFKIDNEFILTSVIDNVNVKLPFKASYVKSKNTYEISTNSVGSKLNINGVEFTVKDVFNEFVILKCTNCVDSKENQLSQENAITNVSIFSKSNNIGSIILSPFPELMINELKSSKTIEILEKEFQKIPLSEYSMTKGLFVLLCKDKIENIAIETPNYENYNFEITSPLLKAEAAGNNSLLDFDLTMESMTNEMNSETEAETIDKSIESEKNIVTEKENVTNSETTNVKVGERIGERKGATLNLNQTAKDNLKYLQRKLIANYPLNKDGKDLSVNKNDFVFVKGITFDNNVLNSKGNYDTDEFRTSTLFGLNKNEFSFEFEIKVPSQFSGNLMPFITVSRMSRILGLYKSQKNELGVLYNNSETKTTSYIITPDKWTKVRLDYSKKDGVVIVSVDNKVIEEYNDIVLKPFSFSDISISNYANGLMFKGQMKNLKVYSE